MSDFDQLFKKLLTCFFPDLLHLACPPLAAQARLETLTFVDKELFSNLRKGHRRFADLVAQLTLQDPHKTRILTHVEVESRFKAGFSTRMWYYYLQLQLQEKLPVFPIVVFLKGGPRGIAWQKYPIKVLHFVICEFNFLALGVAHMDAEQLLGSPHPLAWALAAFAHTTRGKAWLKLACLKRITHSNLDDVRQFLLVDAVETRLELQGEDALQFRRLLQQEPDPEVKTMQMTWASKIEQKGRTEGRQEGRQEVVKHLLGVRFGPLSESVLTHIDRLTSPERLDQLVVDILSAQSLDDLKLS